jgi:hypothetical protein
VPTPNTAASLRTTAPASLCLILALLLLLAATPPAIYLLARHDAQSQYHPQTLQYQSTTLSLTHGVTITFQISHTTDGQGQAHWNLRPFRLVHGGYWKG